MRIRGRYRVILGERLDGKCAVSIEGNYCDIESDMWLDGCLEMTSVVNLQYINNVNLI